MTYVTTLLIVLTLTGGPVANAICVSWCDSWPTTAETTCHERVANPVSMAISDGSSTCATLLAADLFLPEETRITFQAQTSLDAVHALDTLPTGGARLAYIRSTSEATDGRPAIALVLRL